MATAEYTYATQSGDIYRVRVSDAASWVDEPYPPGGFLRIVRNKVGQIIHGPLVSELLSWEWIEES
jgi:hypothetical protein